MAGFHPERSAGRWQERIRAAVTPEDKLLAAIDAVKALSALLARYGNEEGARELREEAASALTEVFEHRAVALGMLAPAREPVPVTEGAGPR